MTGARTRAIRRSLWSVTLLCAVLGMAGIELRAQAQISQAQYESETLYDQAVSVQRASRTAPAMRNAERTAERDLHGVAMPGGDWESMAAALRIFSHESTRAGVRITGLQPQPQDAASKDARLVAMPVLLNARGSFAHLMRFVEDLSHQRLLLRISQTDLTREAQPGVPTPVLDATVNAVVYRLNLPKEEEVRIAGAR